MRRGRRLGRPRTERAAVIYEAIQAGDIGITELAERLGVARSTLRRWLDGESRATAAFSLDALWDALAVSSDDRERLSARLASVSPADVATPAPACGDDSACSPEQARAELVALLRAELQRRHISARALARRLRLTPATVTRFLNGEVARSRLRIEAVCDAIGLGEGSMRRRELLRLAAAGALALSVGAPVTLRTRGLDFDEVARRMDDAERLRAAGQLQAAWDAAQEPELRRMIRRVRALERDSAARATRFRYDFVVATMREQLAPWTASAERATHVIAYYEGVQNELLRYAAPGEVSHELAQIHERIAPLYRQQGAFDESVWSFDFALRQRAERAEDLALAVHLWRNRAHVWAVRRDERRWREDLDAARGVVGRLPADMRDELYGLLTYSEGEGLKRLANQPGLEWRHRQALAGQARETLLRSLTQTRQQWAAHEAVTRLSAAQALVLLDPAAALMELDLLGSLISAAMPAHRSKLALTRAQAERVLAPRRVRA